MNFKDAVEIILSHEGGYVNHKDDPGMETNYGISKRSYPNLDIKSLTREEAKKIYLRDFWNKVRGDSLPFGVALIMFDFAVNAGVGTAVKALQHAVGAKEDGILGDLTMARVGTVNKNFICEKLTTYRILHYTSLKTFGTFGKGWIDRAIETLSSALLIRDYQ